MKSIKKVLRCCIAKVARSPNIKCSGTRQEVSESQLAGPGGVGRRERKGVKEHCYVHRRLQCHSRGLWEHFPVFFF